MNLSPRKEPFVYGLGKRGETAAADYLSRHGYKILERNYRCKIGEIDIVAEKDGRLLFIEIKTRSSDHFGLPEESVHAVKQKKILRTAEWYLKDHDAMDKPVGFEVLAVQWHQDREAEIRCIPQAFQEERGV
jgi:putative endonuclease